MEAGEIVGLSAYLHQLYEDRFPPLSRDMCRLWYEDLHHLPEDIVYQGVKRWARQHTLQPPSLDQLLEQVEMIRDEQRQSRRSGSSDKGYLDVLRDAAEAQVAAPGRTDDDATYGGLMITLIDRACDKWRDDAGVWHQKLTQEERGEQCYAWADQYRDKRPQLARDLEVAARVFLLGVPLAFGD